VFEKNSSHPHHEWQICARQIQGRLLNSKR
jgi:hypothetical protein